MASLPWDTVLHKLPQLVWGSPAGYDPTSGESLQHRPPSGSQLFPGSIPCSSIGSSMTAYGTFLHWWWPLRTARAHPVISPWTEGVDAPVSLHSYFLTNLGVWVGCLSLFLLSSKTKGTTQNKRLLPNRFPLSHILIHRGTDWLNLGQRWTELEPRGTFLEMFTGAMRGAPSPLPNPARQTQQNHLV